MKAKTKVLNLYGGPGTGKSTTAAGVFSALKQDGVNCEYVQEYAKDKAWELGHSSIGTPKVFKAQEYVFAQQHFRLRRCADDVDIIVTDSPLLLGLIYMPEDFELPSLPLVIQEAYSVYDNLDIFLERVKVYNPKGRLQTEESAKGLDVKILSMLLDSPVVGGFQHVVAGQDAVKDVMKLLENSGWIK